MFPTYILAGGPSSRFGDEGDDKARAEIGGVPLILRVAGQLGDTASSITVVADRAKKYDDLGLITIVDHHPGVGPIAGLERALVHYSQSDASRVGGGKGYLLLVSCDLVEVKATWIRELSAQTEGADDVSSAKARVIAFVENDASGARQRRVHPMPALYHSSIERTVQQQIARRKFSMQGLIGAVDHRLFPLPGDWPDIPQINTREDWDRVLGRLRR